MATTVQPATPEEKADANQATLSKIHGHPLLINLGKVKSKNAKKLKKGKGILVDKISQNYQQLQTGLAGKQHPVIISYEMKPGKKGKKKKINFMGIKIDRKKFKDRLKKSGVRSKFL